jgi:hypothetical protein
VMRPSQPAKLGLTIPTSSANPARMTPISTVIAPSARRKAFAWRVSIAQVALAVRVAPDNAYNAVLSARAGSGIRSPAAGWTLARVMHSIHLANLEAAAARAHWAAATGGFTLADILGIVAVLAVPIGIFLFAAVVARRQEPRDDGDSDSGWGRGGPGGWGRGGPGGPPWPDDGPLQPHGDPVWWPEFERQFAVYVGQPVGRSRRLEPGDVRPADSP